MTVTDRLKERYNRNFNQHELDENEKKSKRAGRLPCEDRWIEDEMGEGECGVELINREVRRKWG